MPSGAGQYRFVRVIPVLIFPGARTCVGFVLPEKRQVIPRSRAPILNLPCPRGFTAPTALAPPYLPYRSSWPALCYGVNSELRLPGPSRPILPIWTMTPVPANRDSKGRDSDEYLARAGAVYGTVGRRETRGQRAVQAAYGGTALASQEAQVARLAWEGLSNPEIAARLFITTRTVQHHLSKVFTKLGISLRGQRHDVLPGDQL